MEAVATRRLRIGVFADSAFQPRWMVESLSRAASSGHAELTLVVPAQAGTQDWGPGLRRGDKARRYDEPLLWRAYSRTTLPQLPV